MLTLNFSQSQDQISIKQKNIIFFLKNLSFDFIKKQAQQEFLRQHINKIVLMLGLLFFIFGTVLTLKEQFFIKFSFLGLLILTYFYARTAGFKQRKNSLEPILEILDSKQPQKINILPFLSAETYQILSKSLKDQFFISNLFLTLAQKKETKFVFSRLGISLKSFQEYFQKNKTESQKNELERIILISFIESLNSESKYFSSAFLLAGLCASNEKLKNILNKLRIAPEDLNGCLKWRFFNYTLQNKLLYDKWREFFKPSGAMNRAFTSRSTPFLDSVSINLIKQAKGTVLQIIVNRKKELQQILQTLQRSDGNVLLTGPSGAGKTALVYALAEKMASEDVPRILQDKKLVQLDFGSLIAGAGKTGDLEQKLNQLLKEITNSGNIILFIEDLENILTGSQNQEGLKISDMFMQILPLPSVHLISTAETSVFTQKLEKHSDFLRRFQKIEINELNKEDSIKALSLQVPQLEKEYKIKFLYQSLRSAVDLSARFLHNQYLPAKAINVLKESAVYTANQKKYLVTKDEVEKTISSMTDIPLGSLETEEKEKLLNLEQEIRNSIIDQEPAILAVSDAMRRARADVREDKRPIATFLFVGPTGVGKTELAKTLARLYFGSEERMIRLDMSEYQTQESMARLLGSSTDYGAFFTNAVRDNPFSLILLDELEKAHKEILNIFLQVLEDGRMTDAQNRVVDFTSTIIIATSNAGTNIIQERIKQGKEVAQIQKELIEDVLPQSFRPEFLNRFTEIIVFKPLTETEVLQITTLLLKKLSARLLENQGLYFEWNETALKEIVAHGFDPIYGARPLRRLIEKKIESLIAKFILSNQTERGDKLVLNEGYKISLN